MRHIFQGFKQTSHMTWWGVAVALITVAGLLELSVSVSGLLTHHWVVLNIQDCEFEEVTQRL